MGADQIPSGELWTDQTDSRYELARRYVFAGKEQDVHTGLIDFGARSYDARQGQWLSADPALPEYLAGDGTGGIHIPRNLDLYTYAWNNPLRMKDMDGRQAHPHTYWTPAEHAQAYCNNRGGCTEAEYLAEVNRWGEFQQVGQDFLLNASPGGKVSKTLYQAAKKTPWFRRAWQWLGRALFGAFRNNAKKLDDAADKSVDRGSDPAPVSPATPPPRASKVSTFRGTTTSSPAVQSLRPLRSRSLDALAPASRLEMCRSASPVPKSGLSSTK